MLKLYSTPTHDSLFLHVKKAYIVMKKTISIPVPDVETALRTEMRILIDFAMLKYNQLSHLQSLVSDNHK